MLTVNDAGAPRRPEGRRLQRQQETFPDFAQGDPFRLIRQRLLETFDWFAEWFETEPEGLMVDRNNVSSASVVSHLHGLFRRRVRPNPRIVTAYRHHGDVHTALRAYFGKCIR